MKTKIKKRLTAFAVIASTLGITTTIISFFIKKNKKEVVHNGRKKLLYPQDLALEKTILKLIPDFIRPTYVSFLRIVLTPLAALLIANSQSLAVPLIVYLLVSFTDMIDGAMARTRNQITELGKIIDPIADKLLFIFSAVLLLPKFNSEDILIIMIGLELLTVILSGLFYRKGMDISSNTFGKIKMNLQILGIILFLFVNYGYSTDLVFFGRLSLWGAAGCNVASMGKFILKKV